MNYTREEIMEYVREEDVKFIRLAFCDVFGKQKNISIMPGELDRAFEQGIAIDASAIKGFSDVSKSDLFLYPDPSTLSALPWRPDHGRVVRMFSSVRYPDGTPFECDTRQILIDAVEEANKKGYNFSFGVEQEFYLFMLDEDGEATKKPYDEAGYMDVAPEDKGENIRREICLTLEQMGITPERSHHEQGAGQNEIDFKYSDPLTAADNAVTFRTVVSTAASRYGLFADFSPKPLKGAPGNGFHINISENSSMDNGNIFKIISGILANAPDMTLFFNPTKNSYERLGEHKAPKYVSWSRENRSQLIRIPAARGEWERAEIRSPDPSSNPYLALTLLIKAGIYGIENDVVLPESDDVDLYTANTETTKKFVLLPQSLNEAKRIAASSQFIKSVLPQKLIDIYCN